jgi:hypothetical protein
LSTIIIIVDFDNYFGTDLSKTSSEDLEFAFKEFISYAEKEFTQFNSIEIRLYGGWYRGTILTAQASILQQLLFGVTVFPKIKMDKIIRGSVNMVSSLYEIPEFTWGYTHKEADGMKPVRINFDKVDVICDSNRPNCPKFILNKFTKSKDKTCAVDGCFNIQKNVFKGIEQKMVDTLIACDIVSISDVENIAGIIVVSDDQDHFPSMALAMKRQEFKKESDFEGILLLFQNEQKVEFVKEFLEPFSIKIELLT